MPSFFKFFIQKKNLQKEVKNQATDQSIEHIQDSLSANLNMIKQKTENSSDIVIRKIKIGRNSDIKTAIIYVDGIVDNQSI